MALETAKDLAEHARDLIQYPHYQMKSKFLPLAAEALERLAFIESRPPAAVKVGASFVRLTADARDELLRVAQELRLTISEEVRGDLAALARVVCAETRRLHDLLVEVRVALGDATKQRDELRRLLAAEADATLPESGLLK